MLRNTFERTGWVPQNCTEGESVAGVAGLRSAREQAGLSARALAEACAAFGDPAIDRNRVANLELGRGRPLAVDELLVLSVTLGVPPIDLLAGPGAEDASLVDVGALRWSVAALRQTLGAAPAPLLSPRKLATLRDLLELALPAEGVERVLRLLEGDTVLDLASLAEEGVRDGAR